MMTNAALPSPLEYPLGTFGLALVLVVTRLVEFESRGTGGITGWTRRIVARAVLSGVSAIGTLIDGVAGPGRPAHLPVQMPDAGR